MDTRIILGLWDTQMLNGPLIGDPHPNIVPLFVTTSYLGKVKGRISPRTRAKAEYKAMTCTI